MVNGVVSELPVIIYDAKLLYVGTLAVSIRGENVVWLRD